MSLTELTKSRDVLARVLSIAGVNQLGRETGQATRLRTVTPHRLFLAIVSALAGERVESLADLLRTFNHQNGVRVAYKPFYNRLARTGFEAFMREMCTRLIEHLRVPTLTPDGETAVARFTDIVIQDGSSFAIKRTLQGVFPGRFTTIEPAAVEIHATYSGFADQVSALPLAPDCDAERQFLPDPATLAGRLLLADRGYPSVPYFEAVETAGGSFIVRLTRSYDPWVCAAWIRPTTIAVVFAGHVTAIGYGSGEIVVTYQTARRSVPVRIAPEREFLIWGNVTDSGSPVVEAKAEATSAEGTYSATTDSSGAFVLPGGGADVS